MTYLSIGGVEVLGLTEGERRSLHRSWLGRPATWDDVRQILQSTALGAVEHHISKRSRCDGCTSNVYDWAEEISLGKEITGRRFCRTCAKNRGGEQCGFDDRGKAALMEKQHP
jgi:hypothetical protein